MDPARPFPEIWTAHWLEKDEADWDDGFFSPVLRKTSCQLLWCTDQGPNELIITGLSGYHKIFPSLDDQRGQNYASNVQ